MKVVIKIERFNPEKDAERHLASFELETTPSMRVLDALVEIKERLDSTLAFRKSCAHGVCGSDAMIINEKERLACKTLIRDVAGAEGDVIRISPLRGFPVQRDLIVDQTDFFTKFQMVKPFLINEEPVPAKERLQTPAERGRFDDATKCILCCACFSACPVLENNPRFLGPAIVAQASRFLDDSRDRGYEERLPILDSPHGIWPCQNHFECTRVCPRGIKITRRINEIKRRINSP